MTNFRVKIIIKNSKLFTFGHFLEFWVSVWYPEGNELKSAA